MNKIIEDKMISFYRLTQDLSVSLREIINFAQSNTDMFNAELVSFGGVLSMVASSDRSVEDKLVMIVEMVRAGAPKHGLLGGKHPICTAASYNEPKLVEYFIDSADFEKLYKTDNCPMSRAVLNSGIDVARVLVGADWNPGSRNDILEMAEFAKMHGQVKIHEMLLAHSLSHGESSPKTPRSIDNYRDSITAGFGEIKNIIINILLNCATIITESGLFSEGLSAEDDSGLPIELFMYVQPSVDTNDWATKLFMSSMFAARSDDRIPSDCGEIARLDPDPEFIYSHVLLLTESVIAGRHMFRVMPIFSGEAEYAVSNGILQLIEVFRLKDTPTEAVRSRPPAIE